MLDDQIKILKVHEVNKTDMVQRFLIEMLLTQEWSNEFQHILIENDDESASWHISDYVYNLGLIRISGKSGYRYAISSKGREYLEQRS